MIEYALGATYQFRDLTNVCATVNKLAHPGSATNRSSTGFASSPSVMLCFG